MAELSIAAQDFEARKGAGLRVLAGPDSPLRDMLDGPPPRFAPENCPGHELRYGDQVLWMSGAWPDSSPAPRCVHCGAMFPRRPRNG